MELTLVREKPSSQCTLGKLYVNGQYECETLEDVPRPVKIMKETCIPAGRYQIVLTFSNRFQKIMPLLVGVPGFDGIRIHPGNTAHDTWGCILVGLGRAADMITNARAAYAKLYAKLEAANRREKIFITIK